MLSKWPEMKGEKRRGPRLWRVPLTCVAVPASPLSQLDPLEWQLKEEASVSPSALWPL